MNITLSELSKDWLDASWDFRPGAFWFWNSSMDQDRMRRVIEEMAGACIREVLIHPIHGLSVEYLSDQFFECYRYALSLLKHHGIKVRIYDEYGWPSGNAGGLLLRKHPEANGWLLGFERESSGRVTVTPKRYDLVLDNCMGAPWTGSEPGYLDTLCVEAVRSFIDITYERYYEKCGDYFGDTITGFFTDEPVTMMDTRSERWGIWAPVGLPWTPSFPERFCERFGYDIEPLYGDLAGDGPSKCKQDYWTLVKEMHIEAYHEQVGGWCRDHGVIYSGHVGEDAPLQQVRFTGSVYGSLSQMDLPGVDYLGHTDPPDERWAEFALVSSIARHNGKERICCEAYGIAPLDIKLGHMLRTAEMLGIYGANDIALMGFHQALDGITKHMYWPPLFMESPWWPFFPAYRDALARAVGLTSMGRRKCRYAVLYPQHEMEQTDLFNLDITNWQTGNPGGRMIQLLGTAIYRAGETFDFVFSEMLGEAKVKSGRIVFPHAEYDALLAPGDVRFFDEDIRHLDRLTDHGGRVLREGVDDLVTDISSREPSWSDDVSIKAGKPGGVKVFCWDCPDGELYVLRSSGAEPVSVEVTSERAITLWEPDTGDVVGCPGGLKREMTRHDTLYFSLTGEQVAPRPLEDCETVSLQGDWTISPEMSNTARLADIRFKHLEKGWIDAMDCSIFKKGTGRSLAGIPHDFAGYTEIEFEGEFTAISIPDEFGLLFERDHLISLSLNGTALDPDRGVHTPRWDHSCMFIDIRHLAVSGKNTVSGVLRYEPFETSTRNDLVYSFGPMPTCDVFLSGSLLLERGKLTKPEAKVYALPVEFGEAGYAEYAGILKLSSDVEVGPQLAEAIRGIEIFPVGEDGIEVILDGVSLGMRIKNPYKYRIFPLAPGRHSMQIKVSGITANQFGNPSRWGIESVHWMLEGSRL